MPKTARFLSSRLVPSDPAVHGRVVRIRRIETHARICLLRPDRTTARIDECAAIANGFSGLCPLRQRTIGVRQLFGSGVILDDVGALVGEPFVEQDPLLAERSARHRDSISDHEWTELTRVATRYLRKEFGRLGQEDIRDIAQETMLRLREVQQSEEIANPHALATEIARRRALDMVRQRDRRFHGAVELASLVEPIGLAALEAERTLFKVLETFRGSSHCYELARLRMSGASWEQVAEKAHLKPNTIRKRWQRCLALLKQVARRCPDQGLDAFR